MGVENFRQPPQKPFAAISNQAPSSVYEAFFSSNSDDSLSLAHIRMQSSLNLNLLHIKTLRLKKKIPRVSEQHNKFHKLTCRNTSQCSFHFKSVL